MEYRWRLQFFSLPAMLSLAPKAVADLAPLAKGISLHEDVERLAFLLRHLPSIFTGDGELDIVSFSVTF